MNISDKIKELEHDIKVAGSEGDIELMNQLENQLEQLKEKLPHAMDDDPYFTDENMYCDD
ncbi:hypothetical protein CSW98_08325 [Vibrio sp. HA2012]|uniref:hypothetical protein n=1 Tax=Vibrio sp. HA2012 TaxID=1971595 RepID=UPI000C2CDAF7|nr:hypothetical protein [Vibrio sp. HA2012]PJC86977.1 hypothetical protein CSW98_08325 [Vibrio sp. HA2012]